MRRFKLSVILLSILLTISCIASATDTTEVLVYRNESMPWCGTVDGKDAGITVEILHEITKYGGPKFTFQSLPWLRAQTYVKRDAGTAIIPLSRTEEREQQYSWITELVPNQIRLTMTKTPYRHELLPVQATLDDLKSSPVGVIRGSAAIPILKKEGFSQLVQVDSAEQNARILARGRVAAIAESKWVDTYLWNKIGQDSSDLISGPPIGELLYIYLGASRDFPPELKKQIREAMIKVKHSGALDRILNKWSNL